MNTKKLDKAWPIFEEIEHRRMNSGCVSIGYVLGGTLPMRDEMNEVRSEVQSYTSQPLDDHPDTSLSAEDYGIALQKVLTSGLATKLKIEKILLPTGEFAERLKKMGATYFEYIGLAMVLDDWWDTLFDELAKAGFNTQAYTDEELKALFDRSIGQQGDLYLMLLEKKGTWHNED